MALLGNSGSPRWYQEDAARLDDYIQHLIHWGATSTEMVLHHGEADERTARVHVLQPDWEPMIGRYRDAGIAIQLHASLDARFATERWLDDADALKREYLPLLGVLRDLAAEQGRCVLVMHGASDVGRSREENRAATVAFLRWLAERTAAMRGQALIALELGAAKPGRPTLVARSRADVQDLAAAVGSPNVGICWDLAHDLENAEREPGWEEIPEAAFLERVVHVHLHDLDEANVPHFPLVLGRVPFPTQLEALATGGSLSTLSITMEIRWRCAERLGDPWSLLGQSYRIAETAIAEIERRGPDTVAVRP